MQADDDELWRSIVDNYGERAELDDEDDAPPEPPEPPESPEPPVAAAPQQPPAAPPAAPPTGRPASESSWDDPYPDADWSQERFVPPPPPPIPPTTQDRFLAWLGVFGAPAVLIVCLVLGVHLPQTVVLVLVAAFVGGFLYLVVKMSGEPRDPGDDGARL